MKRRWATVGLALGSVVATVLLVELGLHLVLGPVRVVEEFYEPDPRIGYRMQPDLEFVFANAYHGYRATVRTNSLGLRDDEIVLPKPERTVRILLLGDSMTASLEVEKPETCEALLAHDLSTDLPTGWSVDVINAGVRGYNLDNILAFYATVGSHLEVDLVVYLFVDNDLTAEAAPHPQSTDASRGYSPSGFLGRVAQRSHLLYRFAILKQTLALRRQSHAETDLAPPTGRVSVSNGLFTLFTMQDRTLPAFQQTSRRIGELAAMAHTAGASFLLVGAPHREEIDPATQQWWQQYLGGAQRRFDFDGVREFVAWVGATQHVEILDPIPACRSEFPGGNAYWFHRDNHLNAAGQRVLAEELARWVRQHLEPWPSTPATGN